MTCVVTSTSNTNNGCVSPLSTTDSSFLSRKRRPFDTMFDFDMVTKRLCRCSDVARQFDDGCSFAGMRENRFHTTLRNHDRASFSVTRAVLDHSNPSLVEASNCCDGSSGDDEPADKHDKAEPSQFTKNSAIDNLASLIRDNNHQNSKNGQLISPGPALFRRRKMERPNLLKKMLNRLQLEINSLDRHTNFTRHEGIDKLQRVEASREQTKSNRLYTFSQLCRICRRLLTEQESKLHDFYERNLTLRLSEQYECFLRFTQEQLEDRFTHSQMPSYIS